MAHMLSYQLLDSIADSHNPLLGAAWLVLSALPLASARWRVAGARLAVGLGCLLCAYGFMWLDAAVHLWARGGLDYSTHTGVAVALAAAIWAASRRLGITACVLVSWYFPLMVYQGYHTPSDIITSAMAVGLPVVLIARKVRGPARAHTQAAANNSLA
jgi:hypothetical protein